MTRRLSEETREKDRVRAREWIRRKRAIDPRVKALQALYDRLVAEVGERCAICGRERDGYRRLSIDHDHATDQIRGLLCRPCNMLLGNARDSVEILRAAIAYLELPRFTESRYAEALLESVGESGHD